ncbi:MAG: GtrA family protein, partial [Hyphomicrobium sp.]
MSVGGGPKPEREAEPRPPTPRHGVARHLGGFATSGAIAFTVDATVLTLLTRGFGVDPFVARLAAISVAMVAGWRAHRLLTFNVKAAATFAEFLTYAAVAWTSAAVNYSAYAGVLLLRPGTDPLVALVAASLIAMSFSYLG